MEKLIITKEKNIIIDFNINGEVVDVDYFDCTSPKIRTVD